MDAEVVLVFCILFLTVYVLCRPLTRHGHCELDFATGKQTLHQPEKQVISLKHPTEGGLFDGNIQATDFGMYAKSLA